jgi:hypothetical protein
MLLFAIVLGLAAVAATVTDREVTRRGAQSTTPSPAAPYRETRPTAELVFDAARPRRRHALRAGRRAQVTVRVPRAGQVQIPRLGLSSTAEPLTPARFDVLVSAPGRYELAYTAAGTAFSRRAGELVVFGSPSKR